jgi:hypothetical protein
MRKAELARVLTGCQPLALVLNRVYDDRRLVVFEHACKFGCEGVVSQAARLALRGGRATG